MSEKICKGCTAAVPANRNRCPRCGLRTGAVGPGMMVLFITSAAVAGLLIQDHRDRDRSWVRYPLRAARDQVSPSSSDVSPGASAPVERPTRAPSREGERGRDTRHFTEMPRQRRPAPAPAPAAPAAEVAAEHTPEPAEETQPTKAVAKAPLSQEEQWAAEFKPPEIGSAVAVRLRGGQDMKGTLLALDETQLEIETPTLTIALSPSQLAPATRIRFFLADYLRYRELRAARARDNARARAAAAPPKPVEPAKPLVSDDPFRQSEKEEDRTKEPSSRRSEAADIFMKAF